VQVSKCHYFLLFSLYIVIVNVTQCNYSYYVSLYRYLLTLYCARPPFLQLRRCGLTLMQKFASTLGPQIDEQNKNVFVLVYLLHPQ